MLRRRRPVLRAAALAGGGAAMYHAGKRREANDQHEYDQDQAIQQTQAQAYAPPPQAPAAGGMSDDAIAKLQELGKLHDSGVLTDEEFAAQKAKLLA
jgi:membrane protease subunit (stomatin/prohibitin family)